MTTLKFLRFQTTIGHDEIFNCLQKAYYNERTYEGFSLESNYNQQIWGTFYNTITHAEKILDPLGKEIDTFYIVIEKTEFILDSKRKLLILINPGRSLKHFFTVLGATLEFQISIEELRLDLLEFVKRLQLSRSEVVLLSIDIIGIPLSPYSIGKVSIAGDEDVMKYVSQFKGEKPGAKIKKVRLSIDSEGQQDKIDFLDSFTMRAGTLSKQRLLSIFTSDLEDYLFNDKPY
ncbi:MAG: hypothetical protein AB7G87_12660 [Clostridia bacterium]